MVKYKAFYAFHLVFLVIEITKLSTESLFKAHVHKSCDKQRKIVTNSYGVISSGGNLYPMDSHCEWLIQGNSSEQFITLHFIKMDTECSYDHIFVYDGDSYSSRMLGSFSGNTTPSYVTGSNGAMLILLYSDTNYVRTGFEVVYSITDCKLNCSGQGSCYNHQCLCDDLWSGSGCEVNLCPNNCGKSEDKGECANSSEGWKCLCKAGYSGIDCSLPDSNKNAGNSWHMLSHEGKSFLGRAGHSGVYIPTVDRFYIFGGYTFGKILGDLMYYEFNGNNWVQINQSESPSPRRGHAAVAYGSNFVLYGGELEGRKLSNELWLFNVSSNHWKLCNTKGKVWPPAVTKHSLSLVEDKWLYLFGGNLQNASFSSDMYRIDLDNPVSWEKVTYLGGKHSVRRVVGHTSVYHHPSKTIFIFGGVTVEYSHVSKLSNQIHAFHVERKYWTRVNYHMDQNTPLERAFHTAAVVGDYMVVYGGYTHKHSQEEICYDNATHMYHLRCHKWVNPVNLCKDFEGSSNPVSQGVFSHAMGVRHGHTLLIAGGYSGIMRSTFLAYVLPPVIAGGHPLTNPCSSHTSQDGCVANVACGWCADQKKCKGRRDSCTSFITEPCSGFCSTLSNCHSCLIWGEFAGANIISDGQLIDPFPVASCAWCVQVMKCHSVHEPPPMCSGNDSSSNSISGRAKWWGPVGTEINVLKKCTTDDFQPGLISIKFRHPINWTQPDDVSYINRTFEDLNLRMEFSKNDSTQMEENVVNFIGYLHPLGAKPFFERMPELELKMCSVGSSAVLRLSTDTTLDKMEVVANHTAKSSFHCSDVHRKNGAPIFPNTSIGYKYLLGFTVRIPTSVNESSNVQLSWNAFSVQSEVILQDHLEPYKNGSCSRHGNCLSCLTDAACGWCEADSNCYNRLNNPNDCRKYGEIHFLVTQPNDCSVCSDYIYCEHCAGVSNCEWLVEVGYCVRRGRFAHAVRKSELCPTPCHLRTNCSSCLGDPGVCAWCELTQTCFLFSTYTTSYMYGQCRDWVDENRSEPNSNPIFLCRNCSRRKNCRACLKDLSCGWCSDKENAMEGVCVSGDFAGPSDGNCSTYLEEVHDLPPTKPFVWSYSTCPDIEECLLGTHNCHQNATCVNTLESFTCECNTGFQGDGATCTRACAVKCVNGYCSEAPEYKCICNLGWTGDDCSINCGCHNHSFCSRGVGLCDECKDWTEGQFCEKCMPESYGDAVSSVGCQKCNCNDHGDPELGFCHHTTGVCYCKDNTEGPNCAKCYSGYYGDPKNGGSCYLECKPRGVITNVQMGKLGSPSRSSHSSDCLWLLTVYEVLDMPSLLPPMTSTEAAIQLVIHEDMKIPCPHNHVYVYDGLPDFIASGHPNVLLGVFCGSNLSSAISVVATSGYLTLHFKRNDYEQGFQATYKRLEYYSSECHTKEPEKDEDVDSIESFCMTDLCPNNCSSSQNQGFCDSIYGKCVCADSYGGDDCSIPLKPHNLVWSSLYDYEDILVKTPSIPSSRMGASLLMVKNESSKVENVWLFGGYSPSIGEMSDLFVFDTLTKRWAKVEDRISQPPPRYFHAATVSNDSIYVFGGLSGAEVLGDFWQFNTISSNWTEITSVNLVPLAGSTLTKIKNDVLVLIGGFSPKYGFFDKVMEYDAKNDIWISVNCTGAQPIGIYGHSEVYHPDTDSIYIFGGVTYNVDHVSVSGKLYALNYTSKQWFSLPPDIQMSPLKTKPLPRYFHDAVVTKHFMVVFGGRSSNQAKEYALPFVYIFSCNLWIPLSDKDIEIVGDPPDMVVGTSAVVANGDIYMFGGFNGKAIGELKKLSLPDDFCHLFSINRVGCIDHTGCAFCSVYEKGINQTFCYSLNWNRPPSCYNPNGKSEILPGTVCSSDWVEKLDCQQYGSCTDCVASWRAFPEAKPICQWCSNCKAGRCVAIGALCDKESECSVPRKVVDQASVCPSQMCWASDCEKCQSLGMCIWTRQAQRSSGFEHTLNSKPIYNWICVTEEIQDAPPFPIESMPPLDCPLRCSQHSNCTSCLESSGGEGGWHECVWSETLHMCMSPSFELLRCEDGSCGPVLQRNSSLCPLPCWQHSQASHCLSHSNCGWCAFSGSKVDGRGLCIAGTIMGPTGGLCRGENQVLLFGLSLPEKVAQWLAMAEGTPQWTYLVKPVENECNNEHHTCDEKHEECVDTNEGFDCRCKEGYSLKDEHCKPICMQGCVNGTCVSPDECKCNFGYVGNNCSTPCKCNGHSDCPGPDKLGECIKCLNNTQGPECQKCKPFFVGNPVNGGKCIPCSTYCNGHSMACFTSEFILNNNSSLVQTVDQIAIFELLEKVKEGALEDAECWACQNNTEGKRCDKCISGYFKAGDSIEDGCRLCECHGHGDMCNHLNGENCNCQNNTENDRQCSQKNMKNIITPCWQLQCSKCKEYFLGAPAFGHQCYRHMFLDKDYCFDPSTQEECNRKPNPLLQGRTVFFAVQPRYMNVDIRIVVDVTDGGVDFFLSAKEDTFVVDVNKTSGIHYISIDKKYGVDIGKEFDYVYNMKSKTKRETFLINSSWDPSNSSDVMVSTLLQLREADAKGLTTYVTVKKPQEFLLIKNLKNRLVITIPQEVHDLRSTRFYMVLRGVGTKEESMSFGSLFFRQDQTRIDLFVFFSVFFSCFFLFLAICVVIWKVKQAFDVRRARRLHAAEMKHMASRPFGHIITVIDEESDEYDFTLYSPTNFRKKSKQVKSYGRDSPKIIEDKFGIRPVAIEPASDGIGAVATILIQLPGGKHSLVKMTLASALITMRSSHHHVGYGLRAAMRRRTSHANV